MRELISSLAPRTRIIAIASALFLLLAILALTATVGKATLPTGQVASPRTTTTLAPPPARPSGAPSLGLGQSVALENEIARLRAMTPVAAAPTAGPQAITGEAASHPDSYAGQFVKQLLTQDYRTPRDQLLAWVQSQAAQTSEPLVIAMIPAQLRDKWAVFSVTDSAAGVAPIPTADQWARLAQLQGYTTVQVQRVSEPLAWSSAVSSGRITDAGVTGREVSALVTLHTIADGRATASASSIALTLNLQGPPTRPNWGFVTAVTYTQIQLTPR